MSSMEKGETINIDSKEITEWLSKLTEDTTKPILAKQYVAVKRILSILNLAPEDSPEVFRNLAITYKWKKRLERRLELLEEEEKHVRKQIATFSRQNKMLEKEIKELKLKTKTLEEENGELKQRLELLNRLREKGIGSGSEESDDEHMETFNADEIVTQEDKTGSDSSRKSLLTSAKDAPKEVEKVSTYFGSQTHNDSTRSTVDDVSVHVLVDATVTDSVISESTRVRGAPTTKVNYEINNKRTTSNKKGVKTTTTTTTAKKNVAYSSARNEERSTIEETGKLDTILDKTESKNDIKVDNGKVEIKTESRNDMKVDKSVEKDYNRHPDTIDQDTVIDIVVGLKASVIQREWKGDPDSEPTALEYKYRYQNKININGRQTLKFKHFAPKVFHQIRHSFGITDEMFIKSFQIENMSPIKGEGKSGAFFIFTNDNQFVLKTATGDERDFLVAMLPTYLQYITNHPDTLLPRFYGVYSMKHEGIGGMIRFFITNNLFNTPYELEEKYDLKGSTVGRFVSDKKKKPGAILKDLDLLDAKRKLYLPAKDRADFVKQLSADVEFLAQNKVMDYSLLIGIHEFAGQYRMFQKQDLTSSQSSKIKQNKYGGMKVTCPNGRIEVYYIGIIDVLVQYVARKRFEHYFKVAAHLGEEVSVVHPRSYAERFITFVDTKVLAEPQPDPKKKKKKKNSSEGESSSEYGDYEIVKKKAK